MSNLGFISTRARDDDVVKERSRPTKRQPRSRPKPEARNATAATRYPVRDSERGDESGLRPELPASPMTIPKFLDTFERNHEQNIQTILDFSSRIACVEQKVDVMWRVMRKFNQDDSDEDEEISSPPTSARVHPCNARAQGAIPTATDRDSVEGDRVAAASSHEPPSCAAEMKACENVQSHSEPRLTPPRILSPNVHPPPLPTASSASSLPPPRSAPPPPPPPPPLPLPVALTPTPGATATATREGVDRSLIGGWAKDTPVVQASEEELPDTMSQFLSELTAKMSLKRKAYDAEANDHYTRLHGE